MVPLPLRCCLIRYDIKVKISEFGLSMLMLILLNMFNEVMRYLHDNKFKKPIKCILRPA